MAAFVQIRVSLVSPGSLVTSNLHASMPSDALSAYMTPSSPPANTEVPDTCGSENQPLHAPTCASLDAAEHVQFSGPCRPHVVRQPLPQRNSPLQPPRPAAFASAASPVLVSDTAALRVTTDDLPDSELRLRAAEDAAEDALSKFDAAPLTGKAEAFRSALAAAEAELDEALATARSSTSGALADGSDADDALAED